MNIQLKQNEIEAALKGYVTQQGINLAGKMVNIAFTAGRKESGISAELVIEDSGLPDFSDDEAGVVQAAAAIVIPINRVDVATEPVPAVEPEPEDAQPEPAKTNSLFG